MSAKEQHYRGASLCLDEHEGGEVRAPRRKRILWSILVSAFLTPFIGSSVIVALPAIGKEFGLGAVALSWIMTAFTISAAASLLPVGRMADLYGRAQMFSVGVRLLAVVSFLLALAPSGRVFVFLRILQGIASAMIFATGAALLVTLFPREQGRVLGLHVTSVYMALSTGPFLGGLLTEFVGWRAVFLVPSLLSVVVIRELMAVREEREGKNSFSAPFDRKGAILYALSLSALLYGLSSLKSLHGSLLLLGAVGLLLLFGEWEKRASSPLLDIRSLFMNRVFFFSNIAAFLHYSAVAAVAFLLSLYLQFVRGMPPKAAGGILLVQPLLQALLSPLAGRLSERVLPARIASIGMGLCALGIFALTRVEMATPLSMILAILGVIGMGFGLFSAPNTYAVFQSISPEQYGVASALLSTMRLMGHAFSMSIVTLALSFSLGDVSILPENRSLFLRTLHRVFLILTILCLLGLLASSVRGRDTVRQVGRAHGETSPSIRPSEQSKRRE
jgi:MFS family permease